MEDSQKTVVVGLSGGVDSAVSALLLKKKGYKVIGAFMKNFSDTKNPLTGECSWAEEKRMAQRIASSLEIPFVVFDFEKEYKNQVIKPMYRAYKRGLTPNPDITCNTLIKFPLFWKHAKKLGADYIAMGHYARVKSSSQRFSLLAGKDKNKDQSYFLYELSQSDLEHTLFPIGNLTKEEVRKIAKENHLPNWDKHSTRGICFVGKVNLKSFLEKNIKNHPGKVLSPEGKILGTHPGVMYFTIGQRIGPHLGINIEKPHGREQEKWYVAAKKGNALIAAPENHHSLFKKEAIIKKLHLINPKEKIPSELKARIRHLGELYSGKLKKLNNHYRFIFSSPVKSLALGQSLVLYAKDKIIGGGEISQ